MLSVLFGGLNMGNSYPSSRKLCSRVFSWLVVQYNKKNLKWFFKNTLIMETFSWIILSFLFILVSIKYWPLAANKLKALGYDCGFFIEWFKTIMWIA